MVHLRAVPYRRRDILKDRRSSRRASYLIRLARIYRSPLSAEIWNISAFPYAHLQHSHRYTHARPRDARRGKVSKVAHVTIKPRNEGTDGRTNGARYRETPRKSSRACRPAGETSKRAFRTRASARSARGGGESN